MKQSTGPRSPRPKTRVNKYRDSPDLGTWTKALYFQEHRGSPGEDGTDASWDAGSPYDDHNGLDSKLQGTV